VKLLSFCSFLIVSILLDQVEAGTECGLLLEGFTDWQVGDEVECFQVITEPKKISRISK
jgi:hypothetical protein